MPLVPPIEIINQNTLRKSNKLMTSDLYLNEIFVSFWTGFVSPTLRHKRLHLSGLSSLLKKLKHAIFYSYWIREFITESR